ncbi:MAG: hypothetical protein WAS33_01385 [Candidatus Promineifilaceae bacterium]
MRTEVGGVIGKIKAKGGKHHQTYQRHDHAALKKLFQLGMAVKLSPIYSQNPHHPSSDD